MIRVRVSLGWQSPGAAFGRVRSLSNGLAGLLLTAVFVSLATPPAQADPSGGLERVYFLENCNAIRNDLFQRRASGQADLDEQGNFEWYEIMPFQHCGRVRRLLQAAAEAGIQDKIEFWQGTETISHEVLRSLPQGKSLSLPILRIVFPENVFFDTDRYQPRAEVWPVLSVIADSMMREPDHIALFVAGHADYRGSRQYNEALSRRRARSGLASVTSLGVERGEMYTVAFGEDLPINPSLDVNEIGVNRRLEFLISPVAEVAIEWISRQSPELPCIGQNDRELGNCPDIDRPTRTVVRAERISTNVVLPGDGVVLPVSPDRTRVDTSPDRASAQIQRDEEVVIIDRAGEIVVVRLPVEEIVVVDYGRDRY
ncbi:OmpA family protein [Hyphomonas sp.]|uniref:OmpA family protein n=1 Tax=Hyphomonas sp. TaxID=87 RepID=UPI00391B2269